MILLDVDRVKLGKGLEKAKNTMNQSASSLALCTSSKTVWRRLTYYRVLSYKYNNPANDEFDKFGRRLMMMMKS